MATQPFTSAALGEVADYLVSDRDTHKVLDRKFAELGIAEPIPEPSPAPLPAASSGNGCANRRRARPWRRQLENCWQRRETPASLRIGDGGGDWGDEGLRAVNFKIGVKSQWQEKIDQ